MKNRVIGLAALLGAALLVAPAWGSERGVEIRLRGKMVEGGYLQELTQRDAIWTVSWLHHSDRGDVLSSSFHVFGRISSKPGWDRLRAGFGGEAAAVDAEAGGSGLALAVGGFLGYVPDRAEKLTLGVNAHWAPGVLAFGDLDSYRRLGLEADYRVFRRGTVFLGARSVRVEVDGASGYLDTGLHAGFRIMF